MKIAMLQGLPALLAGALACAAPPAEILIPGQNLFTESVTSTADGSLIVGALGSGAIFRAKPGAETAELWIKSGTGGLANPLGVFADDKSNTLWTCSTTLDVAKGTTPPRSTLHTFDLTTGVPTGRFPLPTAGATCNDIAIGSDGTAYVTDYQNMQIVTLAPGAKALEVWAGDGAFGGKDDGLDGIAIVQGHVIVNAISSNRLFSVPIGADGKAGAVIEVKLDRPLKYPDGQRAFGKDGILVVDAQEGGRLARILLSGEHFGTGKVTTIQAGFEKGPASVAVVGDTAYVIEAQFDAMDKKAPTQPFKAKAVKLGAASASACAGDDSGLTLPAGFCANVFAEGIGHVRHMTVSAANVLYVNTWSGEYYGNGPLPPGGFLVAMQDSQGYGRADTVRRFGETVATGGAGGTGIALYKGYLYAESNDRIVRYALTEGEMTPKGTPEVVVSGLPIDGEHPMHSFAIDAAGMMYVVVASATNTCQKANRELKSPGLSPCKELERRGGIWRYDASRLGQTFAPADRYVSGIRNAEGIAVDASDQLYSTQHGRDQLAENWPDLYKQAQGATLPAEELSRIEKGAVYGWPHCYFDPAQGKLVLAPEYGGDGGRAVGLCAKRHAPAAAFPAHWAPNALFFYQGSQFPARYREGAFIAFHGSWNRAPFQQGGYNVVFQPLKDGKAAPGCEIFADGFAGAVRSPDGAAYRPSGLASGPDGTLYIADDVKGRIYRIVYRGDPSGGSPGRACPSASSPPDEMPQSAGNDESALPLPPGTTRETVSLGSRLYHSLGDVPTMCTACHGSAAAGSALGPNLTDPEWLWSDGSVAGIAGSIREGVAQPKNYRNSMPPMGGAQLTAEQVSAMAAYLWALSHAK